MTEQQPIKTNRGLITDLLIRLHPDSDLNDDETLFGLIYEDYEGYARLIETHHEEIAQAEAAGELRGRNASIEQLMNVADEGDGVPDLGGANTLYCNHQQSIFDIARL